MGACLANASCKTASSVAAAAVRAALACAPLSNAIDDGVAMRCKLSCASIVAHHELHKVSGSDCHYMGCALAAAKPELPHDVAKAFRKLQALANEARHDWPQERAVSRLDSSGADTGHSAEVDTQLMEGDGGAPSDDSSSAEPLVHAAATTLAHSS